MSDMDEDKKSVDWWNRYILTGAVAVLVIVAVYWLITTYLV